MRLTRRGEIVAAVLAVLVLLALMALAGKVEGL